VVNRSTSVLILYLVVIFQIASPKLATLISTDAQSTHSLRSSLYFLILLALILRIINSKEYTQIKGLFDRCRGMLFAVETFLRYNIQGKRISLCLKFSIEGYRCT
jgi:hypothetical protein